MASVPAITPRDSASAQVKMPVDMLLRSWADQAVRNVLRMFGVKKTDVDRIVALPLPADEPPDESI